jgi:hypothetical protein
LFGVEFLRTVLVHVNTFSHQVWKFFDRRLELLLSLVIVLLCLAYSLVGQP